jgi:hypothetical protein
MQRKLLAEVLAELAPHDIEDKVTILQTNDSLPLRQLLVAALDPAVKFNVDVPPYRDNKEVDGYASNSLLIEYRRLYIFLANNQSVSVKRKTEILGQILESIDPSDAKFLEKVIRKDLSEYGLTAEIVNQAWPGLIKHTK